MRESRITNRYGQRLRYSEVSQTYDKDTFMYVRDMVFNGKTVSPQKMFNAYCVWHKLRTGKEFRYNEQQATP